MQSDLVGNPAIVLFGKEANQQFLPWTRLIHWHFIQVMNDFGTLQIGQTEEYIQFGNIRSHESEEIHEIHEAGISQFSTDGKISMQEMFAFASFHNR